MTQPKWTTGLISTGKDLVDLRDGLANLLKDWDFEVLAYEFPDYPVEPHVHSHDACIAAVKRADIVILIIDKRYGGFYIGSTGRSITEHEYDEAVKERKIIIPCIREEAWNEHYTLYRKFNESDVKEEDKKSSVKYADSWDVLEFIEKVRRADTDNFIITFESLTDLKTKLNGRLNGISRYIIETISQEQVKMVSALKTSTGMDLSLGDVLEKGYYIEPPFKITSGHDETNSDIFHYFKKIRESKYGIALYGGPGTGKSTLIAKAFLEHAEFCRLNKANYLPLFVSLRGRGSEYTFSYPEYTEYCFSHYLNKTVYPLLNLSTLNLVFYMDGFDELTEDVQHIDLQMISQSDLFKNSFIFSCRTRFAKDYLNEITFGNIINFIFELGEWSPDLAESYIERFCNIHSKDDLAEDIIEYFKANTELLNITSNPLLLTLFLWVVEQGNMDIPLNIKNTLNLFDSCIKLWIKRDVSRIEIDGTSQGRKFEKNLRYAWELSAWEIYRSRFDSQKHIILQQLKDEIGKMSNDMKQACESQAFIGLLSVSPFSDEVRGMLHEQFLEHFSAYVIAEGVRSNEYPFPESLTYVIRPEINRMIRAIWDSSEKDYKNDTLNNLWDRYSEYLSSKKPLDIFARNQAAYYIGRLGIDKAYQKLKIANKTEENTFVKISISFGLIKNADYEEEEGLYGKLSQFPEWDSANRGYHLTYYRDVTPSSPPPYIDGAEGPWRNTLKALIRHFKSNEPRHIALRRIELFTIRRLLETRNDRGMLVSETIDLIKNNVVEDTSPYENAPSRFIKDVEQEFNELRKAWDACVG